MTKYVSVRVSNGRGDPVAQAKVTLWVFQTLASGALPAQWTGSDGRADFEIDVDQFAQLSISVDDRECIERGSIKGFYAITI